MRYIGLVGSFLGIYVAMYIKGIVSVYKLMYNMLCPISCCHVVAAAYVHPCPPQPLQSPGKVLLRTWREGKRIRRQTLESPPTRGRRHPRQRRLLLPRPGRLPPTLAASAWLPNSACPASSTAPPAPTWPTLASSTPLQARNTIAVSASCSTSGLSPAKMLLRQRQPWIEKSLAHRHLQGTIILYDVTSTYLEGQHCPLAAFGHNRDGKKGKRQMVFGLLCAADGCPLAVSSLTLASQIRKIQDRFRVGRIALVGNDHRRPHPPGCWTGRHPQAAAGAIQPPCAPSRWLPTQWLTAPISPENASWSASTPDCDSNAPAIAAGHRSQAGKDRHHRPQAQAGLRTGTAR